MNPKRIEVIINSASGLGSTEESRQLLIDAFAGHGIVPVLHLVEGDEIEKVARAVCRRDVEVVVAGGGDGTISSVAREVYGTGKTLGVLPLGTLNNFSKDLAILPELDAAVATISAGYVAEIDLAEVNGRIFLNNSSIGLYPRIVRRREQWQHRLGYGKTRAAFWATLRIFRIARFLKVRIELDGRTFLRKTPFVFIGNNEYEMDLYNIGRRVRMNGGEISVYFLHRGGRWGVIMLLWHTLTGRVRQWRDFEQVLTTSITIQSRRKRLPVAFDGEISVMETPLRYRTLPGALRVIVPAPADD